MQKRSVLFLFFLLLDPMIYSSEQSFSSGENSSTQEETSDSLSCSSGSATEYENSDEENTFEKFELKHETPDQFCSNPAKAKNEISLDGYYQPEMEKIWHQHLSWEEIGNKIYGEKETSSDTSTWSDSDDDSSESDDEENNFFDISDFIDAHAKITPACADELLYYDPPFCIDYRKEYNGLDEEKRDIFTFMKTCYIGFEDKKVLTFLKKYQKNPYFLGCVINQTYPSPLFWATINKNLFMVKQLLPYVTFDNPFDRSTLFYAVLLKQKELVHFLLQNTLALKADDPAIRFHPHIQGMMRPKTIKNFLNNHPNLEYTTYAPLKIALLNNDIEMVKLLLYHGSCDTRSIEKSHIPHTTDQRILDLLVTRQFLSPKLLEQKLFFSKNCEYLDVKGLYQDQSNWKYYSKKLTQEEANNRIIATWKKYLPKN
jgi:hypothetical protein